MDALFKKFDKIFIFFIVYTIIFVLFVNTLSYTLPFVLALFFASILEKPTKFLVNRLKFNSSLAAFITTSVFSTSIILLLFFILLEIVNSIPSLSSSVYSIATGNYTKLTSLFENLHNIYNGLNQNILNSIESNISDYISKTLSEVLNLSGKLMYFFINIFTYVPYIIMVILFTLLGTYFFTKDFSSIKSNLLSAVPSDKTERVLIVVNEFKKMFFYYILSYVIFIAITFVEALIAFQIFHVDYYLLLSIITGISDAIPVFGIAVIFIPLIFVYFLLGNYFTAIGLIISFIIISIIRQLLGPKVISSTLGINPIAALAALFIGINADGILGMLFCIFLIMSYNILKNIKVL